MAYEILGTVMKILEIFFSNIFIVVELVMRVRITLLN